jgi:hypothetical protein
MTFLLYCKLQHGNLNCLSVYHSMLLFKQATDGEPKMESAMGLSESSSLAELARRVWDDIECVLAPSRSPAISETFRDSRRPLSYFAARIRTRVFSFTQIHVSLRSSPLHLKVLLPHEQSVPSDRHGLATLVP